MKDIKFRLFDKRDKRMIYPKVEDIDIFNLCFCGDSWQVEFDNSEDDKKYYGKEVFEIMQFTGLLDKNGKEIYEGDIVSLKSQYETEQPIDTKSKVEFSDGSFRLDFHAMILNWAVLEYTKSNWLIEVIGNIYENPELLT